MRMNGTSALDGAHQVPGRDDHDGEELRVQRAVARARAGDQEALRFLYIRYAPTVRRYITGLLGSPEEAEDVTQTVFLKLLTKLDRYEPRGVRFDAWLLRVARNVAFDEVRRRRPVPAGEMIEENAVLRPDERDSSARRSIKEALATLPHAQREVVVLRHFLGLSCGEIAERLDRTEAAVHNLHHRGRANLRKALLALDISPSTARPAVPGPVAEPVAEPEVEPSFAGAEIVPFPVLRRRFVRVEASTPELAVAADRG
jgi:RNA polymerase sigma-70 factor (ECF subfamily)